MYPSTTQFQETQPFKGHAVDDFSHGATVDACEAAVRQGFLRKVFGILTVQMFMTVAVSALFMLNKGVQTYVIAHRGFMTLGFIGSFVLLFALFAKKDEHPLNLQLLGASSL